MLLMVMWYTTFMECKSNSMLARLDCSLASLREWIVVIGYRYKTPQECYPYCVGMGGFEMFFSAQAKVHSV